MHWRFGTGYLCPWTADLTKEKKKKFISLGAAVNGFLHNQSANLIELFFSTLGNKMAMVVLHKVGRLARLRTIVTHNNKQRHSKRIVGAAKASVVLNSALPAPPHLRIRWQLCTQHAPR